MVGADCEFINGIEISGPGPKRKDTTPRTISGKTDDGAYIGKISIPMDSGKYFLEFMLREKDLTEQLKNIRTEKMKEILGDLPESEKELKQ
jgi:hypothetical protein